MAAKLQKKYSHDMIKEILIQPEIVENIVNKYVNFEKNEVKFDEFKGKLNNIKEINRIILLGCGTSYHAALIGNYMLEEYVGLPCQVEQADEFISRKAVIEDKTAIIILSQSGETTDIIKAARLLKKQGVFTICVTNKINSTLARLSDVVIDNGVGDELAVAATKTFISQLVILVLLTLYIGGCHKVPSLTNKKIIKEIKSLPNKMKKILELNNSIKLISKKYQKSKDFIVLGKKYSYPIALEGALKLKEVTYIHAEAIVIGEFKHGPIAIINRNFPCLFIAPVDSVYKKTMAVIREVKPIGAKIIAITTQGNRQIKAIADEVIYIPKTIEILTPILSIIPLQLLSYYIALFKGINVDKPRHLTKFVVDKGL